MSALKHGFARSDFRWAPSPRTELLIRGIAKSASPGRSLRRQPFLPAHLYALTLFLSSSIDDLHMLAAAAVALYLALRPVELAALRASDLASTRSGFTIAFQRMKARFHPVFDSRTFNSPFLVAVLSRYLAAAQLSPSSKLFRFADAKSVDSLAQKISTLLSVPDLHGHSFRIGTATALAMAGYPPTEIKVWGNWRSNAYERYVRNARLHDHLVDPIQLFPPYR